MSPKAVGSTQQPVLRKPTNTTVAAFRSRPGTVPRGVSYGRIMLDPSKSAASIALEWGSRKAGVPVSLFS
jgi:hypothetical protein